MSPLLNTPELYLHINFCVCEINNHPYNFVTLMHLLISFTNVEDRMCFVVQE